MMNPYKEVSGRRPLHRSTSTSRSPNRWSNMEKSKSQEYINTTSDEENPQLVESVEILNQGVEIDKRTTFDPSTAGKSNLQAGFNFQDSSKFQDSTNLQGDQNIPYQGHQTNFQTSGQDNEIDFRTKIVEDATHANNVFNKSNSPISPDSQQEYEPQRESEPQPGQQWQPKPQQMSGPQYQPESAIYENLPEMENLFDTYKIWIGVVVIFAIVWAILPNYNEGPKPARNDCSFDSIKKEFPSEEIELWKSLKVGTDRIVKNNPASPSVYLFLHSNGSAPQKLIRKIAQTAADCLDPPRKPVVLDREDFTSEESIKDYGQIIKKFKERIGEEGGALIVANLNEIPGEAALALHFICDIYTPIVPKLLIFMTLVTAKDQVRTPTEVAERTLYHLWSSNIKPNELDPLIARVTDQVFQIHTV